MAIMRSMFIVLVLFLAVCYAKKSYRGYQLLSVKFSTDHEREILTELSTALQLDVWKEGPDGWDILIPPYRRKAVRRHLENRGISFKTSVEDMQRNIDEEESRLAAARLVRLASEHRAYDYGDFNTFEDIQEELDALVDRCPDQLTCKTVVHGETSEGREIRGIRIYREGEMQKKIWIDATIHAREWLATATAMKIISHIVDDYQSDVLLRSLVDLYDWYLLPVLNPDGYSYTWSNDRLWRKNRSENDGSICFGTDLNRNYDDGHWGTSGSSAQACSDTYRGASAGSELEIQAAQRALVSMGTDIILSVNLHTYGQMWLMPWSYTLDLAQCYIGPDHDEQMVVTNLAADAVQATHGTVWTRGPFCTTLYAGSGTSVDFAKGKAGIKHAFLPELRGTNFIVSNMQIQPSFEETWNGIVIAIHAIEAPTRLG